MAKPQSGNTPRKSIGKFARTLLATTCLTLASAGAALATSVTYTEGSGGLPADFPNTSVSPTALAAAVNPGTTIVNGNLFPGSGDTADWFELTGLGIGNFTLTASNPIGYAISIFDSSLTQIGSTQTSTTPSFGPIAIPGDEDLVVELSQNPSTGEGGAYAVTVNTTAAATPEPSTFVSLSLGLAGMLALRRKLKQSS